MSVWTIDKQFGFDYGHRVWSQTLNAEYSIDSACVCRHLHGHRAQVHVFLEGEELHQGMVSDFKHLNWLKNFLDDNLDHKFIIDRNDPWFSNIINGQLTTAEYTVARGQEEYPVPGCNPADDFHIISREVLKIDTTRVLKLIPSYVPGTNHLGGYNLDVSKLEGPEQEFYEGFFIVDFLPTSENLSKWVFDCVDAKMKLIDVKTAQVDWFETPKSRSSYRG